MPAVAKRFPPEVTTVAGELYFSGLEVREICERLNAGSAGYPHPIDISLRSTREKVREYEAEHGPRPPRGEAIPELAQTISSYEARARQAIARLDREIAYYDRRRPGSLSTGQMERLHRAVAYSGNILLKLAAVQRRTTKPAGRSQSPSQSEKPESILERMAREEREASSEGPHMPDTTPPQTTTDSEAAAAPSENARAMGHGQSANGAIPGAEPTSGPIRRDTPSDTNEDTDAVSREGAGEGGAQPAQHESESLGTAREILASIRHDQLQPTSAASPDA